jgi:FixJ family two-component response regulator
MAEQINDEQLDCILIDDDAIMRDAWQMLAERKGIKLRAFSSAENFDKEKHKYKKDVRICIDYSMPKVDGVAYSKQLAAEGFSNLYLVTSYDADYFEEMPWLKGIIGKEPYFR